VEVDRAEPEMTQDQELRARLNAAIDRHPMLRERELICRFAVNLLLPEIKKLIREAIRTEKSKQTKESK
jgi:hypothetical protein